MRRGYVLVLTEQGLWAGGLALRPGDRLELCVGGTWIPGRIEGPPWVLAAAIADGSDAEVRIPLTAGMRVRWTAAKPARAPRTQKGDSHATQGPAKTRALPL